MSSSVPLRRNRAYQGVFWSQAFTDFCEQFLIVAIVWATLHQYGGARMGIVMAAWAVPRGLLMLFGGVLVDRLDRRRLAITVGASLAVLSVAAALVTRAEIYGLWILVAVGLGVLDALRLPVAASILPQIVARDQLVDANRWASLREWAALAGAPAVGGVLVAIAGAGGTMVITAVLYLASVGLMLLAPPLPRPAGEPRAHVLADLRDGLMFVVRHRGLRILLVTFAVANLFILGLLGVAIPVFAKDVLNAGPQGLGFLSASFGVGLVLGTLVCTRLPGSWQRSQSMALVLFGVSDLLLAAVGLAPNLALACTFHLASGLAAGPAATFYRALLQTLPPENYLGRVNSIARAMSFGLEPVSTAGVGALSTRVSASALLLAGGAAAACADLAGAVLSRLTGVEPAAAPEPAIVTPGEKKT
ncbi:MFS transporter [Actinoplanes sp. NPDC049802]|uniref:MFS transporter n=1 Tax=Actinoplanes sp. NPDC049802 TaxID=3154742 RepID=UPI0033F4325A